MNCSGASAETYIKIHITRIKKIMHVCDMPLKTPKNVLKTPKNVHIQECPHQQGK